MHVTDGWATRAALAIGEWLAAAAEPVGGGVTWQTFEVVRGSHPTESVRRPAGFSLYRGTAGISLFLTELGRVTGRSDLLDLSCRALEHAFATWRESTSPDAPILPGLYSGATGLPFAAAAYLRVREDTVLRTLAAQVLDKLSDMVAEDRALDLLAGSAGAVIALLGISDVFDSARVEALAERFGDHLLDRAQVEPTGLSWPGGGIRGANLCGLAHGAAGIGWALLELFARTGRASFRLAAEEALAYEDTWYEESEHNWADLRNGQLSRFKIEGRMDELAALVDAGGPLPIYRLRFMTGWCHGAPGIGMVRARAFQLLGEERYRASALAAMRATLASLQEPVSNHCLCHGSMGNLLAQWTTAQRTERTGQLPMLRRQAADMVRAATGDGGSWIPGGVRRAVRDPTLMMGEAGIGLGLLALEHDVVEVVLPVPHGDRPSAPVEDAASLRARIARDSYPATLAALSPDRRRCVIDDLARTGPGEPFRPTGEVLESRLRPLIGEDPRSVAVFEEDQTLLDASRAGFDRSFAALARWLPPSGHSEEPLALAPWVGRWESGRGAWLVFPDSDGRWSVRRLTPRVRRLIETLDREPTSVEKVGALLAEENDAEAETLTFWVRAQLRELARAGVVIPARLAVAINRSKEVDDDSERERLTTQNSITGSSVRRPVPAGAGP